MMRRIVRITGASVCAAAGCVIVALGGLDRAAGMNPDLWGILLISATLILVSATVAHRVRFQAPSARAQRVSRWLAVAPTFADIELALALVLGTYAIIGVTGGLESQAYPLLYGVVAFAATFLTAAGAWVAVIAALALEAAAYWRTGGNAAMVAASAHGAALAAAGLAHAIFLRGLAAQMRRRHVARIEHEVRKQRAAARDYRLISASLGAESRAPRSRAEEEHMLAAGGAATIDAAVFHLLMMLRRSLDARTCILLWLEQGGTWLKIKERVTDNDRVIDSGRVRASGVIGAIVRDRETMCLRSTKPGQIAYLDGGESVGAFLGVPVLENGHLRGVLCADRPEPFEDRDVEIAQSACVQVLRAIQAEQVFRAVERSKYEHERFYHASAMLGRALTMEQVMETAFDAAAQIVDYEVGAFSIVVSAQRGRKRHRLHNVRVNEGAERMLDAKHLSGLEFRDNAGLAAMVVKNKHYLPAAGEVRENTPHVYIKKVRLRDARSLLVLPLLSADEAIGTLMLAARRERAFNKDVREMLGVIAGQVAVSLQNAMMYKKMETMATTDGLTGLTNHRTFQERFAQLLERSERHGHQASVLLCDVDHFKKVNDTYGHPVGDEVLRRVARVLEGAVRKIDIPARYGGEEFAVVLENTGEEGALRLADRIRTDVSNLVLDSDQGTFKITMSIGVASFPGDSRDRAELIERADHALYHAKESGRNRVVSYTQFSAARHAKRAS